MDILAGGRDLLADLQTLAKYGSLARESVQTTSFAELNALVRNLTQE
jgi:hypothetical protein